LKGKIKWYCNKRGYGFLEADSGQDFFIHKSELSCKPILLEAGQKVLFEIGQNDKGDCAVDVKLDPDNMILK